MVVLLCSKSCLHAIQIGWRLHFMTLQISLLWCDIALQVACGYIAKPHGCGILSSECTIRFSFRIFVPTADRVVHSLSKTSHPCDFAYPTLYWWWYWHFRIFTVFDNTKLSSRTPSLAQLNLSLWWQHDVDLWRHNGARRHAHSKHYEYFITGNCTQTDCVHQSKIHIYLLYIHMWLNNVKLNGLILVKLCYIFRY